MKAVRLRPRAKADLAEIRRYTKKAWGLAQARHYLSGLDVRFKTIAAGAAVSTFIEAEGRLFRRCRYHEHLIFFEETPDSIVIVRVLHPRMNIAVRLHDE